MDFWVGKVESWVLRGTDAGLAWVGFATATACPQFAQGLTQGWKSGLRWR